MRYALAVSRLSIRSLFKITPGLREKHDYRRDASFDGDYVMRLPDRTLVPASEYEVKLKAWREEHSASDQSDSEQ